MILFLAAGHARAQDPVQLCRQKGADHGMRPIPLSLVPAAKQIFRLKMPDRQVLHSTVFRCADGHVLLCTYGANLPCGKANSDRDLPGAEAWCRDHPNADFVPRFAIPWGNIYNWGCADGNPKVIKQIEEINPHCFVALYWRRNGQDGAGGHADPRRNADPARRRSRKSRNAAVSDHSGSPGPQREAIGLYESIGFGYGVGSGRMRQCQPATSRRVSYSRRPLRRPPWTFFR